MAIKIIPDTTKRVAVLESVPVDPSLLTSANWWFDVSWYGLMFAGAITGLAALATVFFLFVQFLSSGVKERHTEWRTTALESEIAKAKAELGKANANIAESNARQKEAELKLAELREKLGRPRKIDDAAFLEALKNIPPATVEMTLLTNDPDSFWLAFSIWGVLKKVGWSVITSKDSIEPFGQTPPLLRSCAGNVGGIAVLSKNMSKEDAKYMTSFPRPPRPPTAFVGLWNALWKAVGENEAGLATCPFVTEGHLHIVIAPRWTILPQETAPLGSGKANSPAENTDVK